MTEQLHRTKMAKARRPRGGRPGGAAPPAAAVSDAAEQEIRVRAWKDYFCTIIENSPTRLTSERIAKAVDSRLPPRALRRRRVSRTLIDKWRSRGGKQKLVPSEQLVASALVDALDELGAFQASEDPERAREQLMTLLGFEALSTREQCLKAGWRRTYGELLARLQKSEQMQDRAVQSLSDSELLVAASCLMSQQAYRANPRSRSRIGLVAVLTWDAGTSAEAQTRRAALAQELKDHGVKEYLQETLKEGVETHVVFGIYPKDEQGRVALKEVEDDLEKLHAFFNERSTASPTSSNREIMVHHSTQELTPATARDLWILLCPEGEVSAWAIYRHPNLFSKLRHSSAATFCSPVRDDELKVVLALLRIEWKPIDGRWRVEPGTRIEAGDARTNERSKKNG